MINKHIAMISYHTCPLALQEGKESGGMETYVLELSKSLSKLGYHIDVFTRMQDDTSDKIVSVNSNFQVIHLKAGPCRFIPKKERLEFIDDFSKSLHRYITEKNKQYDIWHAHYYMSGMAALLLKDYFHMHFPLVTTFHTLALMKNLVARTDSERESEYRIKAEFELSKRSDFITASSTDKEYLQTLYDCPDHKIATINPGVDTKLFHRIDKSAAAKHINENPQVKIIMFVGRIEPLKGIDVLMYALKIFLHRNPKSRLKLMIVGGSEKSPNSNGELEKLKVLQHTLQIHPSVEFIPQQTQEILPYYYNYADIVVIPSHYESFGMTALEAMACGTSIITTVTSGVSSIINKDLKNTIVSANNPLHLAKQIESVIHNQKKHEILQQKVMQKVKKMTWMSVAKKMSSVYDLILSDKNR